MSQGRPRNMAASVKDRLHQIARTQQVELQSVLVRYAIERFLYRLSLSDYHQRFILKGANAFALWLGETHRPTRDLDFLGYGSEDIHSLVETFRAICRQPVEDDGLMFKPDTITSTPIRESAKYAGIRVTLQATLNKAVILVQIDIGFGDVVTPAVQEAQYPTLLNSPKVVVWVYPRETVIAEKCEALVDLGLANSRLKDFYDLWHLATHFDVEGSVLCQAIAATFLRRGTLIAVLPPPALTNSFYSDPNRQRQWEAFLTRSRLSPNAAISLEKCIHLLHTFLLPPLRAVQDHTPLESSWRHSALSWQE